MKILIAYATKYATAEWCAKRLQDALRGTETDLVCLEREQPDVSRYDIVVLGSSVYFGKLRPAAQRFLKEQGDALQTRSLGLFLCCGLAHEYEYYTKKLFPESLREKAFEVSYFGGSLRIRGAGLLDRLLLHSMRSSLFESEIEDGEYTPTLPSVLPESVDKMATYIRREIVILNKNKQGKE